MGATCSSSVLKRYGDVKAYLQSKKCMTFDVVEAFLPIDDRPPVILIGENHSVNDSDFGAQACLTAFGAMNELVSKCDDPSTKIFFVVEEHTNKFPGRGRDVDGLETHFRFSLSDVWRKSRTHAHHYGAGLKVVPFDMFYNLRGYYTGQDNRKLKRMPFLHFEYFTFEMKTSIEKAFEHFDAERGLLYSLFDECDARVSLEIESYRERIGKMIEKENADNERFKLELRRKLERDVEANFDAMLRNEWQPDSTEAEIFTYTNVNHFELFKIVYWIYCFTTYVLMSKAPDLAGDLKFAHDAVDVFFGNIMDDPKVTAMFSFITLCGDFITYAVFLRPKLQEKGSNSIIVLYGGSAHMLQFARLIEQSSTHKQDFARVSERACRNPSKSVRPYCENKRRQTPEEFVDILNY